MIQRGQTFEMDLFFTWITDLKNTYILVIPVLIFFLYKRSTRRITAFAIIAVLLVDLLGARGLKPAFGRIRPNGVPFSFPSNHALNLMFLTVYFSYFFKKSMPTLFAITLLLSFSRLYLNLHYPTDILGGWFFGGVLGYYGARGINFLIGKYFSTNRR